MANFTCPECGSHSWGTDSETNTGWCHGYKRRVLSDGTVSKILHTDEPCRFHWKRTAQEDIQVGISSPVYRQNIRAVQ